MFGSLPEPSCWTEVPTCCQRIILGGYSYQVLSMNKILDKVHLYHRIVKDPFLEHPVDLPLYEVDEVVFSLLATFRSSSLFLLIPEIVTY